MADLIRAVELSKYFEVGKNRWLHAVDHVSFTIPEGKTMGVVGESGCGKSTLGRVILGLLPATGGEMYYRDKNIIGMPKNEFKEVRHETALIFQDPFSSLDPRMSVYQIISEPLIVNKACKSKQEQFDRVKELMDTVGLADRFINAYPHEMDGGRRQRVGIARALALNPKFVVCDEPVSALDVSIQAQILNLLMDMQDELNLTYMFITHDLSVVKHISDEIMVMYLGNCVEKAPSRELFANPMHPYTQFLLSAIPIPRVGASKGRKLIKGEVSNPIDPPVGCRFAKRCPYAKDVCTSKDFELVNQGNDHYVACALFNE